MSAREKVLAEAYVGRVKTRFTFRCHLCRRLLSWRADSGLDVDQVLKAHIDRRHPQRDLFGGES